MINKFFFWLVENGGYEEQMLMTGIFLLFPKVLSKNLFSFYIGVLKCLTFPKCISCGEQHLEVKRKKVLRLHYFLWLSSEIIDSYVLLAGKETYMYNKINILLFSIF